MRTDLRIDASYSYRTYSGCYEDAPSANVMIESAKQKATKLWGERATFIIDPKISKVKYLPTWTNMIWASGPAINEELDGSELIVIWWGELQPENIRVLDAIDWNKHAKDYEI